MIANVWAFDTIGASKCTKAQNEQTRASNSAVELPFDEKKCVPLIVTRVILGNVSSAEIRHTHHMTIAGTYGNTATE